MEKISFDEIRELLMQDRSVRRFHEEKRISRDSLVRLVELTRYCASGRNMQPLRYRILCTREECEALFPLIAWAGYLSEWPGAPEGERPAAYIVQCLDTQYGNNCLCDDGLHLQAISLGAVSLGLGGCIVKAFDAAKVSALLGLEPNMVPRYIYALGYPKEEVEIVDTDGSSAADIKYYRDDSGRHYVPKRPLGELLI